MAGNNYEKLKSKSCPSTNTYGINTRSGNALKDDILQFKLENEVGAYLEVLQKATTNKVYITLKSKKGKELSTIHFITDGSESKLVNVTFSYAAKKMEFEFLNGDKLECDLTSLINKIESIDQKTLDDMSGTIDGGLITM